MSFTTFTLHLECAACTTAQIMFIRAVEVALGISVAEDCSVAIEPTRQIKRCAHFQVTLSAGVHRIEGHIELINHGPTWNPNWSEFTSNGCTKYTISFLGPDYRNEGIVRITKIEDLMNERLIRKAIIGTSHMHRLELIECAYDQWMRNWSKKECDNTTTLLQEFDWRKA